MDTNIKLDDNVSISKSRYEVLLAAERFISALNAAGVDNWEGYDYACKIYEEGENFRTS